MKNLLLIGILTLTVTSCVNKKEQQAKDSGYEIYFAETTYDYGQIEQDSDGIYKIEFKNLGQDAIIINKVRSSCGCTAPSWPRKPIEPGDSGEIQVKYNTALAGSFMKSVYVYSSAKNSPVKLTIKGKVIPIEKTE
ncbi:MAG: DUF1573 domain-containing protein [Bacteroidales bacterium]|jgi:hypothetical protein|nr:DUF1573 domain-containing protein [Bacteroidales bacterium]